MPDLFQMRKKNLLAVRYVKRITKDGKGKTSTEIAPGITLFGLVEELSKYLPKKDKNYD